jgi:hypothetical protein
MADGAQLAQRRLSAVAEVTRGTTPNDAAFKIIPHATAQLKADRGFTQSELISSNLKPAAFISGNSSWSGNINTELVVEDGFKLLEESAWLAAWTAVALASVGGAYNSAGTFTRSSGNFLTDTLANRLAVGDIVFGTGSTNNRTQLNGAINSTDTTITVDTVDATTILPSGGGFILIDSEVIAFTARTSTSLTGCRRGACGTTAASHLDNAVVTPGRTISTITATVLTFAATDVVVTEAALTISFSTTTKRLIPGTTRKILTFEENFQDLSSIYRRWMGGEQNNLTYSVPTTGPISVAGSLLGTAYASTQSSGTPTYAALVGRKPFAGAGGSGGSITYNGSAFPGCIENLSYGVERGLAVKNGVGEEFACFVEQAKRRTLPMSAGIYLVSNAMQALYLAGTRFAIQYVAVSPDGDLRRFNFPEVVTTDNAEGESGQTFIENLTLGVEVDATEGVEAWFDEVLKY